MFEIRAFSPNDLDLYQYNGDQIQLGGTEPIRDIIKTYAKIGPAFCGVTEGHVVAIAGIVPVWRGVGQTWMVLNKEGRRHALPILKRIRKDLPSIAQQRSFHRVQTIMPAGDRMSMRFAEIQGLRYESTMECFGQDGRDYLMYKKVYEWVLKPHSLRAS